MSRLRKRCLRHGRSISELRILAVEYAPSQPFDFAPETEIAADRIVGEDAEAVDHAIGPPAIHNVVRRQLQIGRMRTASTTASTPSTPPPNPSAPGPCQILLVPEKAFPTQPFTDNQPGSPTHTMLHIGVVNADFGSISASLRATVSLPL